MVKEFDGIHEDRYEGGGFINSVVRGLDELLEGAGRNLKGFVVGTLVTGAVAGLMYREVAPKHAIPSRDSEGNLNGIVLTNGGHEIVGQYYVHEDGSVRNYLPEEDNR